MVQDSAHVRSRGMCFICCTDLCCCARPRVSKRGTLGRPSRHDHVALECRARNVLGEMGFSSSNPHALELPRALVLFAACIPPASGLPMPYLGGLSATSPWKLRGQVTCFIK
jgi:hypothetical protein